MDSPIERARQVIVHADDVGLSASGNRGYFHAHRVWRDAGLPISASIQVPCPWFADAAARIGEDMANGITHDMGVHLTLTSEWAHYRQAPVLGADRTPTLVDEQGLLPRTVDAVIANANAEEMALEMAAQVARAADFGITPTHLDCHMGVAFASPEFLGAYLEVANQFALPAFLPAGLKTVFPEAVVNVADDAVWVDHFAMATPELAANAWPDFYTGVIDGLQPGLTLVVVHLAFDDPEMAAMTKDHPDYGAAWRQRDLDVVTSERFINLLTHANVDVARWSGL